MNLAKKFEQKILKQNFSLQKFYKLIMENWELKKNLSAKISSKKIQRIFKGGVLVN